MQFVKLTDTHTDCMFSSICAHLHLILLHVCVYLIHAVLTFTPKLLNLSLTDFCLGLHVNLFTLVRFHQGTPHWSYLYPDYGLFLVMLNSG